MSMWRCHQGMLRAVLLEPVWAKRGGWQGTAELVTQFVRVNRWSEKIKGIEGPRPWNLLYSQLQSCLAPLVHVCHHMNQSQEVTEPKEDTVTYASERIAAHCDAASSKICDHGSRSGWGRSVEFQSVFLRVWFTGDKPHCEREHRLGHKLWVKEIQRVKVQFKWTKLSFTTSWLVGEDVTIFTLRRICLDLDTWKANDWHFLFEGILGTTGGSPKGDGWFFYRKRTNDSNW